MLKIEEGKYYKTRDGRKVGPMERDGKTDTPYVWDCPQVFTGFTENGLFSGEGAESPHDLIAEWTDGPVVTETVTKTRIVPGVYGRIEVDGAHGEYVNIRFVTEHGKSSGIWSFREDELDAAAAVLSALAKGLRDA